MTPTNSKLTPEQLGTIEAVLIGFNHYQIPRLLEIRSAVDKGQTLTEYDIIFLRETLEEVQACEGFAATHSDFQMLIAEVASLYEHITHKAAENQAKEQNS